MYRTSTHESQQQVDSSDWLGIRHFMEGGHLSGLEAGGQGAMPFRSDAAAETPRVPKDEVKWDDDILRRAMGEMDADLGSELASTVEVVRKLFNAADDNQDGHLSYLELNDALGRLLRMCWSDIERLLPAFDRKDEINVNFTQFLEIFVHVTARVFAEGYMSQGNTIRSSVFASQFSFDDDDNASHRSPHDSHVHTPGTVTPHTPSTRQSRRPTVSLHNPHLAQTPRQRQSRVNTQAEEFSELGRLMKMQGSELVTQPVPRLNRQSTREAPGPISRQSTRDMPIHRAGGFMGSARRQTVSLSASRQFSDTGRRTLIDADFHEGMQLQRPKMGRGATTQFGEAGPSMRRLVLDV